MKSKRKNILLIIASCIFLLSLFSYNTALSLSAEECYGCVNGGCMLVEDGGYEGCSEFSDGCFYSGNQCECSDPTVPCEY